MTFTRRKVGGTYWSGGYRYVMEDDAGVPRASFVRSLFRVQKDFEADGVAYRHQRGRGWFEVVTGREVLQNLRNGVFVVDGRGEFRYRLSKRAILRRVRASRRMLS